MLKRSYSVKKERSQKNTFKGVVEVKEFPRLANTVVDIVQPIEMSFKIFNGYSKLPEFQGQYSAQVTLQCQRCLSDYKTTVTQEFHFYIARNDQDNNDSSDLEVVNTEDGDMLDIISTIEDDIILNLPLVPKHETDCNEYLLDLNKQADIELKPIKKNPFAVLEGFKTNLKH